MTWISTPIRSFGSYAELFPSSRGGHLIKAKLSGKGWRSGKIELYDSGWYFPVTGKHISRPFAIQSRRRALEHFAAELFPENFYLRT